MIGPKYFMVWPQNHTKFEHTALRVTVPRRKNGFNYTSTGNSCPCCSLFENRVIVEHTHEGSQFTLVRQFCLLKIPSWWKCASSRNHIKVHFSIATTNHLQHSQTFPFFLRIRFEAVCLWMKRVLGTQSPLCSPPLCSMDMRLKLSGLIF